MQALRFLSASRDDIHIFLKFEMPCGDRDPSERSEARESTGAYWRPVYSILERALEIVVASALWIPDAGSGVNVRLELYQSINKRES
jgi:hypothetical protein